MDQSQNQVKIAVLILNFNGLRFLPDCFRSLEEVTYPLFDTFLIDNASSDLSIDWTKRHFPNVHIVKNTVNLGFASAYDQIIRELDYEYVVLLNNDTMVDREWLEALYKVAESDQNIGACGSKILMMWDRSIIDHAGGMLTLIGSGLDRGKWLNDQPNHESPCEIGFACGCSMLLRRKTYLEVGGFDTDYFMYHEDVDLCWRMRLFGYSLMYVPESIVYHSLGGGKTQGIESPLKVYHGQKNRLANIVKNMERGRLVLAMFVSAAYDAVRTLRFIFIGRSNLVGMLLKGYVELIRNLKSHLAKRRFVQHNRKITDRAIDKFFYPLVPSVLDYRRLLNIQDKG